MKRKKKNTKKICGNSEIILQVNIEKKSEKAKGTQKKKRKIMIKKKVINKTINETLANIAERKCILREKRKAINNDTNYENIEERNEIQRLGTKRKEDY